MNCRTAVPRFIAVALLLVSGQKAWAQSNNVFPEFVNFATAWDTYVPDNHPFDHPSAVYGSPPPLAGSAYTPYGLASDSWVDGRNGANGIVARVPNGQNQDAVQNPYAPGPSGGYGVAFPTPDGYGYGEGDSGFVFASQQDENSGKGGTLGGGTNLGGLAKWSQQMSIYLTPNGAVESGANPGLYQNSHNTGSSYYQDYNYHVGIQATNPTSFEISEDGISVRHLTPTTWQFNGNLAGGNNQLLATNVASGQWVTMEVRWDFSGTTLAVVRNLWQDNSSGVPIALLGSSEISAFLAPASADAQGGPAYQWLTETDPYYNSYDHIDISSVGVGPAIAIVIDNFGIGDMNNDGFVNNFDIGPFEEALANPSQYAIDYPSVNPDYRGDINFDGSFDNFDIGPFESLLANGHYPSAAVPEPSTLVLMALGALGLVLLQCRRKKPLSAAADRALVD